MAWFLSPTGWPTYADSSEEQADLSARGYDALAAEQVQAAIDAFNATVPPSTQLPGYALAVDVAAALASKANASSLPGKLSISDIPNPATPGGAALRAALEPRSPAATYTYEVTPDGSKRIKTETKGGVTMTYTYDDANGGRVKTQSDGTTTWTFGYDADSLITGVAA
jgi:hypothetical protein